MVLSYQQADRRQSEVHAYDVFLDGVCSNTDIAHWPELDAIYGQI